MRTGFSRDMGLYADSKSNGSSHGIPMDFAGSQEPLFNSITFGGDSNNCCMRCLRSSPCSSLCGLFTTFLGLGFACGGLVFGIQYSVETLGLNPFFHRVEIVPYIVTGITAFYILCAYILCVVCSGSNMHYVFSKDSYVTIGRVLNILFIIGCLIGVFLWVLVTCLLWTPVYAITALRVRGPQLNLTAAATHDLSYYGMYGTYGRGVQVTDRKFQYNFERLISCFSVCLTGCVLIIMGFMHVAVCCGMNYARMDEVVTYGVGISKRDSSQADTHL